MAFVLDLVARGFYRIPNRARGTSLRGVVNTAGQLLGVGPCRREGAPQRERNDGCVSKPFHIDPGASFPPTARFSPPLSPHCERQGCAAARARRRNTVRLLITYRCRYRWRLEVSGEVHRDSAIAESAHQWH